VLAVRVAHGRLVAVVRIRLAVFHLVFRNETYVTTCACGIIQCRSAITGSPGERRNSDAQLVWTVSGPVRGTLDPVFLDRKKVASARLVGGPAGELVLDRVRDEPFQGRADGLVVGGVDDQPGAGCGLHREAGGGHL